MEWMGKRSSRDPQIAVFAEVMISLPTSQTKPCSIWTPRKHNMGSTPAEKWMSTYRFLTIIILCSPHRTLHVPLSKGSPKERSRCIWSTPRIHAIYYWHQSVTLFLSEAWSRNYRMYKTKNEYNWNNSICAGEYSQCSFRTGECWWLRRSPGPVEKGADISTKCNTTQSCSILLPPRHQYRYLEQLYAKNKRYIDRYGTRTHNLDVYFLAGFESQFNQDIHTFAKLHVNRKATRYHCANLPFWDWGSLKAIYKPNFHFPGPVHAQFRESCGHNWCESVSHKTSHLLNCSKSPVYTKWHQDHWLELPLYQCNLQQTDCVYSCCT